MSIMVPIEKSHIKRAGYDDDTSTLILEFGSGTYCYDDVPRAIYDALMACESKGKYFHGNIRNTFKATRIAHPAERYSAERALTESYNELAATTPG